MLPYETPRHRIAPLLLLAVATATAGCEPNKTTAPVAKRTAPLPTAPLPTAEPASSPAAGTEVPTHDDASLTAVVTKQLLHDRAIDRAALKVSVTDGIVSLTGEVASLLAKERATRLAESVRGVRTVSNRLEVAAPDVPNAELKRRIESALDVNPVTDGFEVEVAADDGDVTLTGRVDSWAEYMLADRVAAGVLGVTVVENRVIVQYPTERSDEEILEDVRGRLAWDVLVDHALVDAEVKAGKVTLTGMVKSAAEKRRAINDARVNGVQKVVADQLKVEPWIESDDTRASKYASVSDDAIRDAIEDAAALDPRLTSLDITPKVDGGVVTLYGKVPSLEARRAAMSLARNTVGVIHVSDQMEIAVPAPFADESVEQNVEMMMKIDPVVSPRDVNVEVEHGLARLTGLVDSPLEKAQAESVASRVSGVEDVDNQLTVANPGAVFAFEPWSDGYAPLVDEWAHYSPPETREVPSDAALKKDVLEQLFWEPQASHWKVKVSVDDGIVTLTGTVDSWAERAAAAAAAFQAGARVVTNELAIEPG